MRIPVMVERARGCTLCEGLPLGPRPLVQGSGSSRVLLIGQAPGRVTHERGLPWDDASGDRLRGWLGVTREQFYDPGVFAHMPMGFCYPGQGASGDLPPREECAPAWHPKLLRVFRRVELTILIGTYSLRRYEPELAKGSVTEAVGAWERLLPGRVVLPHPSGRNNIWLKKNPWFEGEVLPVVRGRVEELLG
ncbi:MAG: uracil-DNA glycosylase family protein [Phycisphaerales bacterium JB040]